VAADHLAAMSIAMVVAYALIGLLATGLARRGIPPIVLLVGGLAMAQLTLLLLITETVGQTYLLWIAYGAFSSVGTLAYSLMSGGFPVALSGRANATLNLMVFVSAFAFQWGLGVLIDVLEAGGCSTQIAHRNAFAVLFFAQAAALLWLCFASRKTDPISA
jgi:hypothetical protein